MDAMRTRSVLVACLVCQAGCGGGGGGADNALPDACAAVITYGEPVFTVTSAVAANGAIPIPEVSLSGITVNGTPLNLGALPKVAHQVQVSGGTVKCQTACGFATDEGQYSMVASAPGYRPATLTFTAKYASFTGGCGVNFSGGTSVAISLQAL